MPSKLKTLKENLEAHKANLEIIISILVVVEEQNLNFKIFKRIRMMNGTANTAATGVTTKPTPYETMFLNARSTSVDQTVFKDSDFKAISKNWHKTFIQNNASEEIYLEVAGKSSGTVNDKSVEDDVSKKQYWLYCF